ncbi:MAG: hypothetical protein H6585_04170 [Flavobacteriales bacterium]|nr:hypothetical protein [Flavobacteriales bacterium]MCB9447521.1 hypothetical protein [Flavobacteriales bacterium]
MKKLISVTAFLFMMGLIPALAQPPVGGPSGDPGPAGPDNVPIDGGIGLLIAAGLVYGGKKAYDYRKN